MRAGGKYARYTTSLANQSEPEIRYYDTGAVVAVPVLSRCPVRYISLHAESRAFVNTLNQHYVQYNIKEGLQRSGVLQEGTK